MKVMGFMTLHYGKEFLREALLSVRDHVDVMVVAYTALPSHGHTPSLPCPDSKEELYVICREAIGDKLAWHELEKGEFYPNEASHREVRYKFASRGKYDLILTVDADEAMIDIPPALEYAYNNPERYYGIDGYKNFFRSFNWICTDGFRPVRIENLRRNNQMQNLNCPMTIYHFSCALTEATMRYKYSSFGHANEIKKDYLDEIFYKWHPVTNPIGDLHCVSYNLWNAVAFDKTQLPEYLKIHPYYNLEIIS